MRLLRPLIVTGAVLLAAGAGSPASASAVPGKHHSRHPFLLVSPVRNLVHLRGQQAITHITVENKSSKPEVFVAQVGAFGEKRNGDISPAAIAPLLAEWLTVSPSHFVVRPGEIRTVTVVVHPTIYDPGDHYFAISFYLPLGHIKHHQGRTTISASVGIAVTSELIVISPGPVHRNTVLGISAPGFATGGPVPVSVTVTNHGNVYTLMNGLRATDPPGIIARYNGFLVLAGATETQTQMWAHPPLFCMPCTIKVGHASATVWIIPLWQLLGILAIAGGIVGAWLLLRGRFSISFKRTAHASTTGAREQ
jgi:hypothetical protein